MTFRVEIVEIDKCTVSAYILIFNLLQFIYLPSNEDIRLQTYGKYVGHYHSVRHIEVSDDFKYMLSASEDHSIYLWLNETMQPDHILVGHTDLCVSDTTLKAVFDSQ